MRTPMISVVMPVYNGEKYLQEAIDSILTQTFTDFEFIILNDGSTDKTEEIILSYDDPRIIYVKNEKNLQIVKTLNKGIALAKGKYIARMDADDISLSERFEKQIKFLNNDQTDVIFSRVMVINQDNQELSKWEADSNTLSNEQIGNTLAYKNCLAHPTMMIKSSILKKYLYTERAKNVEDYTLWLILYADGYRFYKIDEPLVRYRVHSASLTQNSLTAFGVWKKQLLSKLIFLNSHRKLDPFSKKVLKSTLVDTTRFLKDVIKPPLRSLMIVIGKIVWRISPKKIDTDILFIFPSAGMGGAERVHLEVLKASNKYSSFVVITKKSKNKHFLSAYKEYSKVWDISIFNISKPIEWIISGYLMQLVRYSTIKVVFGSRSGIFYDLAMELKSSKIKYIDLFHASDGNLEYYAAKAIKKIDRQIFIDNETMQFMEKFYGKHGVVKKPENRLMLISNGVSVPSRQLSLGTKDYQKKRLTVLFVGRDAAVKRIGLIRQIANAASEADFVLVGVESRGDDPVNLSSVGEHEILGGYYQDAHILLMTSEREGFPMAVMESMAYGVVPVCTNVGGLKMHIQNGHNGYLVPDRTEEAIVNQSLDIIRLLDENREHLEALSKNAYVYAQKHFSIENFYENYQILFDEMIGRNI